MKGKKINKMLDQFWSMSLFGTAKILQATSWIAYHAGDLADKGGEQLLIIHSELDINRGSVGAGRPADQYKENLVVERQAATNIIEEHPQSTGSKVNTADEDGFNDTTPEPELSDEGDDKSAKADTPAS